MTFATSGMCVSLMPGMRIELIFTTTPVLLEPADGVELTFQEELRRIDASQRAPAVADPCVDPRADFGIDGVDRERDVADLEAGQFVHIRGHARGRSSPDRAAFPGNACRTARSVAIVSSGLANGSPGPAMPTTLRFFTRATTSSR